MRSVALLAVLLLAGAARADEARGLALVRQAQQRLGSGDAEGALELLDEARVELPGSEVVACTRGDALLAAGRPDEAADEYQRALSGPRGHHAHFNRGVARHRAAEQPLAETGVPPLVDGLPEGPLPQMLQAVERALPGLEAAREDFLAALDRQDEPAARESVAALNNRVDALMAIRDELRRRAEQQPQEQQQEQPQDQPENGQDDPQEPPPDPQQEQPPQPSDQPQDGQPEEPSEPPPDPQQERPQEAEPPPEPAGEAQEQPQGEQARQLSPEEVQRLLDTLEQLEDEARERARLRAAARRKPVEKDW